MRHFRAASLAAVFLYILGATRAAYADNTGVVRGTITRGGKAAANVPIALRGEGTTLRATTDASGHFSLPHVPFGHYTIAVARDASGEFTEPVDVAGDAVVDLPIELAIKTIGRARTSATRGVASAPVAVNTIGRAEIGALPDNQSLDRVVQTVPGIVRFSYNEPVAHGFHGLTYEIDGVPIPSGTAANFSEPIDPRDVDSLEVFTGAFPAEFGGSRQGAVVNVLSHRSTDAQSGGESGTFTAGVGSYGSAQTSLTDSLRSGTTQIFVNANLERTDRGIDSPTFDPIHDASNQSNQFLRTITGIGPRDTLAFDFSNDVSQFQIPINSGPNPNDPVSVPAATNDVQREYARFANVVYTNNAKNGNAFTQIAPWYRDDRIVYDGDIANDLLGTIDNGDGTFTPLDGLRQDRRSSFYGIRVNHFHAFGPNAVKIGLDTSVENFSGTAQIAYTTGTPAVRRDFFDVSQQRGTQTGAYVQDKWTPTQYVSVEGGLRYDHSTGYTSGSQLSPRIEINGEVDPQDILHAYYGSLYAAPFLEDTRRAAVVLAGGTAQPVYDLQPEHDQYYEFGLAHTLAPGARATLNFWKRDVRNVLDTTQLAQTPIEAVFNNTIGIAKGIDGRVDVRFKNGDTGFFSTTLSQSRAGGVSGSTFLFCPPGSAAGCSASNADLTLQPEDHDQTFAALLDYSKRLGRDRAFFASLEPQYGTGYPIQFQNGPGRLPPHLTFDASFGRDANRGTKPAIGFTANFTNFTNSRYLIKVNNGFNTTQWGEGFRTDLRITAPF